MTGYTVRVVVFLVTKIHGFPTAQAVVSAMRGWAYDSDYTRISTTNSTGGSMRVQPAITVGPKVYITDETQVLRPQLRRIAPGG